MIDGNACSIRVPYGNIYSRKLEIIILIFENKILFWTKIVFVDVEKWFFVFVFGLEMTRTMLLIVHFFP